MAREGDGREGGENGREEEEGEGGEGMVKRLWKRKAGVILTLIFLTHTLGCQRE